MAIIKTIHGVEIIVDDDKVADLSRFRWHIIKNHVYAYVPKKYKSEVKSPTRDMQIHRYLKGFPKGMVVDHINCNPLDNRLENLEIVTNAENVKRAHKNGLGSNGYHRKQALKYLSENLV